MQNITYQSHHCLQVVKDAFVLHHTLDIKSYPCCRKIAWIHTLITGQCRSVPGGEKHAISLVCLCIVMDSDVSQLSSIRGWPPYWPHTFPDSPVFREAAMSTIILHNISYNILKYSFYPYTFLASWNHLLTSATSTPLVDAFCQQFTDQQVTGTLFYLFLFFF